MVQVISGGVAGKESRTEKKAPVQDTLIASSLVTVIQIDVHEWGPSQDFQYAFG